jgi:hypothetical protein
MYQTVTRAPCLSGANEASAVTYTLEGNRLKLDGMVLEKQRR